MGRILTVLLVGLAPLVIIAIRGCPAPSPPPGPAPTPAPNARAPGAGLRPVDGDACHFGDTLVGTAKTCDPVWRNQDAQPLTVAGHQLDDGGGVFAVAPPPGFNAAVPAGGRTPAVRITYTPDAADADTGKFTPLLDVNDVMGGHRSRSIDLEGRGVTYREGGDITVEGETQGQAIDFGSHPVGSAVTRTLRVKNGGSAAHTLTVSFGTDGQGFSLVPAAASVTLAAGEEKSLTLRFDSPLGRKRDAVLLVDASSPSHLAAASLTGEGVASPPHDGH